MPTRGTKRTARGIGPGLLLAALVGASAAAPVAAAVPCEALVGKWKWFTGGVVSINPDGTIAHEPGNDGTWECTDAARSRVTLRWRLGGYVNRLTLSGDGRSLASTDPSQSYVTAQRVGAPRTVEAPAPAKPAEPSRRAETPPAAKPSQTTKATGPTEPRTITPPADAKKAETPPGPALPPGAKSGQAGPCSGKACMAVALESAGGCVWLRSSATDVVLVDVRLATETIRMSLEKPDMAKVAKEPDQTPRPRRARQVPLKKRLEELRKGSDTPAAPKVEEAPAPAPAPAATVDRSRAWHGTAYDPLSTKDQPVFHARIDRAGGCVTDRGEILGYRVRLASAPLEVERTIPCSGEACADVDASPEQTSICRLANRGGREIVVGIVRGQNQSASIQLTLRPNGTAKLDFFSSCLKADEIGRIDARYK